MVNTMNKTEFINKLTENTGYDKETCFKINNILESNFFISKKNKDKIINAFINELSLSEEQANNLYNTCVETIKSELKDKLKHPFKNKE